MKIVIFGVSGMLGKGVLREALNASDVESVLIVVRSPTRISNPKVLEVVHSDFSDFSAIEKHLQGYDACFFGAGVSASGVSEAQYKKVTYDLTLAAAETLARLNPKMIFIYVSGLGTDSTGKGKIMWARIKGQTENALLRLPFKAAFMFRPAYIHPSHGEVSQTALYRFSYKATGWLFPILNILFPRYVITMDELGRAVFSLFRSGGVSRVIESAEIKKIGRASKDES